LSNHYTVVHEWIPSARFSDLNFFLNTNQLPQATNHSCVSHLECLLTLGPVALTNFRSFP